jgi:general secretion pathway protein B
MSLILDALNRADHERKNQDAVPGLNTVHVAPVMVVKDKPANKQNLYWAIAVAIAAMGASTYWFSAKPETKNNTAIVPANETRAVDLSDSPASQTDSGAANTSAVIDQAKNTTLAQSSVSLAEREVAESVITNKPAAVVEQLYVTPTTQTAPADAKVNELYAAEEAAGSESIADPFPVQAAYAGQPARITQSTNTRMAEALPARTFASITNIQDFNELPWNTKQQIPTISYQRHNFLAGGVSSVVINGQTLGEGNIAASSQLIVQEIFEDGVILRRGEVTFKLRALNGWINM